MSGSLAFTLSLITGPALLTNASTVLLLGATNRLGAALDWQRILEAGTVLNKGLSDDDIQAARRSVERRISLLHRAMMLLQVAAGSSGIGTLVAMLGISVEQTTAFRINTIANPALLASATVGGLGLILGVVALFKESWLFDSRAGRFHLPENAHGRFFRMSSPNERNPGPQRRQGARSNPVKPAKLPFTCSPADLANATRPFGKS